jgi:hypothetical protein
MQLQQVARKSMIKKKCSLIKININATTYIPSPSIKSHLYDRWEEGGAGIFDLLPNYSRGV